MAIVASGWAAEVPTADSVPAVPPPVITDVELPQAFIEAQPILVPEPSTPFEPPKPPAEILPYQIETGASFSGLSKGYASWTGVYADAEMKLASRNNIYASFRQENRYSKNDTEMMGGFYEPVNDSFTVIIEGSASSQHNFLAMRSFFAQLQYEGSQGWIAGSGFRHAEYNNATVNLLTPTVERSWGNYRASFTRFQSFFAGQGRGSSQQAQFARYYGDHNWVGVTVSSGTEYESLPNSPVLSSKVRTLVVSGLHWYKPKIGLTYTLGNYRQGTFYTRNGLQLGLRYQF
jgi:YaiO family outer membrane protein